MSRLATLVLGSSLLVGCVASDGAGDEGMYIQKAIATTADSCAFSSTDAEAFIGHGTIYVGSPNSYLLHPQVKSRITTTSDLETTQKTIQIRGARVNLEFADSEVGAAVPAAQKKFQSLFTGPLAPNGGITDATFEVLPEDALASIFPLAEGNPRFETEVIAKVTVFGDLAGDEVTSQEFRFPITVCSDCVVNVMGACPMTATGRQGNACNPYQDGVVDCCTTADGITCPGTVGQN